MRCDVTLNATRQFNLAGVRACVGEGEGGRTARRVGKHHNARRSQSVAGKTRLLGRRVRSIEPAAGERVENSNCLAEQCASQKGPTADCCRLRDHQQTTMCRECRYCIRSRATVEAPSYQTETAKVELP